MFREGKWDGMRERVLSYPTIAAKISKYPTVPKVFLRELHSKSGKLQSVGQKVIFSGVKISLKPFRAIVKAQST
jgi:hypothetical protein